MGKVGEDGGRCVDHRRSRHNQHSGQRAGRQDAGDGRHQIFDSAEHRFQGRRQGPACQQSTGDSPQHKAENGRNSANKMLCDAVIYNLQCIGESVNRLSDEFTSSYPQIDWPAIAGLRHILVHDYFQVNMYRIWMIVQNDLPVLNEFLRAL